MKGNFLLIAQYKKPDDCVDPATPSTFEMDSYGYYQGAR
jgi:hypothetical protein